MKKFFALCGLVGLGVGGHMQAHAQGRWTLTPSLTVAERFDDNIFLTTNDRKSDFITEFTPGLVLLYDMPSLSLSAGYSITGQLYADNSSLDNIGDNQAGFLSASYRATPQLTLGLALYYARTNEPQTFLRPPSVPQGVTVTTLPTVVEGQNVVNQFTLTASGAYQFDTATTGLASYSFAANDSDDISNTVNLGVIRQLTAIDQGTVTATVSVFDSTGTTTDTDETETSVALLLGWNRQWTPSLATNVALGPQVTTPGGDWNVAAILGLRYQVQRELSVALTFTQGSSLVVGESGPQLASTLVGTVNYQASQLLRFSAFGSIGRTAPLNDFSSNDATISYAAGVTASYQLTRWMSAYLQYQYTLQDEPGGNIQDNQVILGLTLSYPFFF